MKHNYKTFNYVIKEILNRKPVYCMFENRNKKYLFGIKNYGEIPKWYNKADGDPWDIFAPGYNSHLQYNVMYKISKIVGVFFLNNGNHKIAVRLQNCNIRSLNYENYKIKLYCKNYMNYTKKKGIFIPIESLEKMFL